MERELPSVLLASPLGLGDEEDVVEEEEVHVGRPVLLLAGQDDALALQFPVRMLEVLRVGVLLDELGHLHQLALGFGAPLGLVQELGCLLDALLGQLQVFEILARLLPFSVPVPRITAIG